MAYGLWQRRFGGDESIVGRVVTINERPTTIVGVMPQGFGRGSPDTDLWLPLTINRAQAERGGRVLSVIGRLADGVERRSGAQRDGHARRRSGGRLSWHEYRMGRHARPARRSRRRSRIEAPVDGVARRRRFRAAHRLRERREPALGAKRFAPARDRHPGRARRGPVAAAAPASHREPRARRRRRAPRRVHRGMGRRAAAGPRAAEHSAPR